MKLGINLSFQSPSIVQYLDLYRGSTYNLYAGFEYMSFSRHYGENSSTIYNARKIFVMHKAFQAQDHILNKLNQWFAHIVDIEFRGVTELVLDSINISLGKWTLTSSSKDDLHSIANKLPKYFHRLYSCYKVSPSCK
jgi:hypothetical protein